MTAHKQHKMHYTQVSEFRMKPHYINIKNGNKEWRKLAKSITPKDLLSIYKYYRCR
jgi:hypothetical protein